MLPVPSTLVKVRRTNLLLQRRSGRRKPIEDEGDDEPRDLEDVTAQKATKVRLNTKDEDSFPRTPVPPIKTNSSLINRRRQQFARDEYTPTVNPYQKSAPLLPHGTPLPCNADNQLRALLRFSSAATDFCSSFLATVSQFHQLPTYVSQYDAADISSACSCFGVTVGCCIPTTGGFPQTSAIPTTTTAHSQSSPAQSRERSVPSQTPQTASSSPRPATEESSFSRPLEYHGPPPTSEAIITASAKGPTFVPDPIVSEATITAGVQGPASVPNPRSESTSTHNETFTLVNVPMTIATVPGGHGNSTAVVTAIANPHAYEGGGGTLSSAVVAVSVIFPFGVIVGLVWLIWRQLPEKQ